MQQNALSAVPVKNSVSLFAYLMLAGCLLSYDSTLAKKGRATKSREYIQIKIYHATDAAGLATIDQYLQRSLLPALTAAGLSRTGFFAAVDNDTAKDKRLYVIAALTSLSQAEKFNAAVDKTVGDSATAPDYTKAGYNASPFTRIETILLRAFEGAPQVMPSRLQGDNSQRVYELRSYESATEALHQNKVKMFNSGEVELFQRLGFNAVFYGQVIAGSAMPNLMYMTSFDNKAARDEHWKTFGSDAEWKAMSSKPEYQHNVSKNTIVFLRPMAYSKL